MFICYYAIRYYDGYEMIFSSLYDDDIINLHENNNRLGVKYIKYYCVSILLLFFYYYKIRTCNQTYKEYNNNNRRLLRRL